MVAHLEVHLNLKVLLLFWTFPLFLASLAVKIEEPVSMEMDNHMSDKEDSCYDHAEAAFSDDEEEINSKGEERDVDQEAWLPRRNSGAPAHSVRGIKVFPPPHVEQGASRRNCPLACLGRLTMVSYNHLTRVSSDSLTMVSLCFGSCFWRLAIVGCNHSTVVSLCFWDLLW